MLNKLPNTSWANRILLRTEVGSTAHGTGLEGKEDYDEIAVMSQSIQDLTGMSEPQDTIVYRPGRKPHEKSGPGDWDLTVHSAKKWCTLASKGNPSILVSIFGPRVQSNKFGDELVSNSYWFYSDKARLAFLGYAKAQRERLERKRGGRPELEDKFGFDTKYAMHMVRLGFQGIEYMHTGSLKLPMVDDRGDFLRKIRKGEISLSDILELSKDLEDQLKNIKDIRPEPDYKRINNFLLDLTLNEIKNNENS